MEALPLFTAVFWICTAGVLYASLGYPVVVWCLGRYFRRPPKTLRQADAEVPSVSFVTVAHNEAARIGKRIDSALGVDYPADKLEVLVICDGCSDATAAIARALRPGRVRVFELPSQIGKAAALTRGCAEARHDIVVLADARQSWGPETLRIMLENFADPSIGAVSGDVLLEKAPGVLAGVGLYYRFDKWLRDQESRFDSMVGVSGAVSAVRRRLFLPIPKGTILDDVYWPLRVVMQGYRVVLDDRARVYDHLPETPRDEFRRKIRTLSGNYQLIARLPAALLPWRNRIWFQYVSHKIMRLLLPWMLLGMLVSSLVLEAALYRIAFWGQVAFHLAGLLGICWKPAASRLRVVSVTASFLVLNAASWLGFWVWLSGRTSKSWVKAAYKTPTDPIAEPNGSATNGAASEGQPAVKWTP